MQWMALRAGADAELSPHKGSNKPLRGPGPRSRFWSRATGIRATAFIGALIEVPALTVIIVPLAPEAQEAGKVARIGWLSPLCQYERDSDLLEV